MLNKIIDFSIKNRLIVGLLTLALIAWGGYNFTILPIDAVPDITNNQVQIITVSPSLAPQEVEQFTTFPVEIAMANIQDVMEIRSISRYGLSVVTVVFKDHVDPYLARQLVSEQIKLAEAEIPEGMGTPEMMPVTTGLGEIYQYVLEAKPGFEKIYTPMEIRTVQDWIVKRFLSGIPGIVEISSFGGFVKQYEVTIDPRLLVSMDITISEIFSALEKNNQNTGGSYIEKGPNAYYIRAEGLVESIEDIQNIVITKQNDIPIAIKDIAKVQFGSPPRFGAMTKDGKGEVVGGITLMLKGANSNQVIKNVKERIEELKKTLPEGLEIHAYLDRSELIHKTINTVSENLILGGLIVIFVLVVLLGNFRAGLIVASVIPLSMLFAFSMMNLFGVSANLMSLGALDFGMIVDGTVIIVEGIIHQIHRNFNGRITQQQMDENIYKAGVKVNRAAVFGVAIILIVYLPILSFSGIEGKMFKPMAQTVSYALIGALILSFTYVPMMASLTLSKNISNKTTIADRIMGFFRRAHKPTLELAMKFKTIFLSVVLVVIIASFFQFSRMGGEFLPTLEEGDLAAQMALPPGSSLSESIASSTKAEKILMENFPEIIEIVSKIGTAEVPTDPMAVEDADIMIIMKPKSEWVSADNREELMGMMKEKLDVMAGVEFEFTQPIQLRFNELMTGVKSDVAVKIYGEDLDLLFNKGNEAAAIIQSVAGAGDVRVEKIVGLPQIVVDYNYDKMALFDLNIDDVNKAIRTAFAGEAAGVVFEGEKRFDLVVRLDKKYRENLKSLQNLRINRPGDDLILLSQVANISFVDGPMQISRDNTKRRIVIGINVRNRDVESFVEEVNDKLQAEMKLPPGYYFTYGGSFENLKAAQRSSSIAVPVALALIFVLLYFTFHSLKQSIMIFTAIPLSAVGGIWALYLRDMPFSISGGVGFIALFGVAVLDGIVLISYYNQLQKEGMDDIYERVRTGTSERLRPVLMTSFVAALGFLPMAISTAAGAEVQRPLATVVIGGIISSTFLTLVVLPILYLIFNDGFKLGSLKKTIKKAAPIMLILLAPSLLFSQANAFDEKLSLDRAIQLALENNAEIKNSRLNIEIAEKLKKTSFNLPAPEFMYQWGQINSSINDKYFDFTQSFGFPTIYTSQRKYQKRLLQLRETEYTLTERSVVSNVKSAWYNWFTAFSKYQLAKEEEGLYAEFLRAVKLKYETGEINLLSQSVAETQALAIGQRLYELELEKLAYEQNLKTLLGITGNYMPKGEIQEIELEAQPVDSIPLDVPGLRYLETKTNLMDAAVKMESNKHLPDLSIGYFNQSIDKVDGFEGWHVGVSFPVWFWSQSGRVQAAKLQKEQASNDYYFEMNRLESEVDLLQNEIAKYRQMIVRYQEQVLSKADQIIRDSNTSLNEGEISYFEYVLSISQAYELKV
ncbi:MAG: CusA/CzcA family heavy metal efflux RND transporter, partial [Bacteroidales bacterium]|nr:CusA/CzcA family heavy metal efflux RND transporter [Bacteroidales bacterium]